MIALQRFQDHLLFVRFVESPTLCSERNLSMIETIFVTTFGSGDNLFSSYTPPDYNYTTPMTQVFTLTVNDGYWSIMNSVQNSSVWHVGSLDHTENDTNGYMVLVNAYETVNLIYNRTVYNLTVGKRYEFSAYIGNVMRDSGIKPNIQFEVRSLRQINRTIVEKETGDISESTSLNWVKYGLSFITPETSISLLLFSKPLSGYGNDFVVDDIAFYRCSDES